MEGGKCGNMLRRNWLQPVLREAGGPAAGGGAGGGEVAAVAVGLAVPAPAPAGDSEPRALRHLKWET